MLTGKILGPKVPPWSFFDHAHFSWTVELVDILDESIGDSDTDTDSEIELEDNDLIVGMSTDSGSDSDDDNN